MSNKNSVIVGSESRVSESQDSVDLSVEIKETDKTPECKNRKLHKAFIKGWVEDIEKNGFARCIIASCNFISSDVSLMQKHYKSCNGVSLTGENSCNKCGSFLATNEELIQHKDICKRASKTRSNSTATDEKLEKWKHQINTVGQAFCGNQDCNFSAMELAILEDHSRYCAGVENINFICVHCLCEFSTKEEFSTHQESCNETISNSKKVENLHFRVIKQMKNNDLNEEHIIQPGPDLPKGEYRRRRAYRAEHKNSWALTLERFKYVKCIYQNCYFIAMSLEDMITHFGYCNGDGSFAKFVCPFCNGRVTSEEILLKHIDRSHSLENNSVEVDDRSDRFKCEIRNLEETTTHISEKDLDSPAMEDSSVKEWHDQIRDFGYGYCKKPLCNFMAPTISKLEAHLKTCDGTPNFTCLTCQKCRYRVPTKADLARHVPVCDENRKYVHSRGDMKSSQADVEDDFEIGPVFRQYQSKPPKVDSSRHKRDSTTETPKKGNPEPEALGEPPRESQPTCTEPPKPKGRGRPRKYKPSQPTNPKDQVKCGKCGFCGSKRDFITHNMRTHIGLGWLEGESPVDMNDEKLLIRLVKEAFKLSKKGTCELCNDVKRSVMGFVSHIQNCGKTEEEKDALKAQCPHCGGKYLKYSLAVHIKLSHPSPTPEEEKSEVPEEFGDSFGKRRSAIKAVTKLQEALNENYEPETHQENIYVLYEKGSEKIPKLNSKLNNLWYKLKRERKKIACRHPNCKNMSEDVKTAKDHHYNCPFLPERVFMCELCDFYSQDEPTIKSHVTTHRKYMKQKKASGEDEIKDEEMKEDEEEEEDDGDDDDDVEEEDRMTSEEEMDEFDETRKRKKKRDGDDKPSKKPKLLVDTSKTNSEVGFHIRQSFCKQNSLQNRGSQLHCNGLVLTLQEEKAKSVEAWPELHTTLQDWSHVSPPEAERYLPELTKSVSVRFQETKWQRFERFEGDLIEGVPTMFTGGSIRSLSWCKISFKRTCEKTKKQYLAVATGKGMDYLKDVYERSPNPKTGIFQIWDCGPLENDLAKQSPKFSLGIVQNGGEIWDMAWFPDDTYMEGVEGRLTRLGLLATATEDGIVRVWSVCDPEQLENSKGLPVYKTEPLVMLIPDKDFEDSCWKLSIASEGIIAGGYANGNVAVWNLKNISSPFCKKSGKCRIIRAHVVLHAHKAAISSLTFCPLNNRYVSTAGLDRFFKVWDLEFPSAPVEQYNREYSLDNTWTLHWPSVICNVDDVIVNFSKGPLKFIRDIINERHQSTFGMNETCLSLSFSDWLNAICAGSVSGAVKCKLLRNLVQDQRKSQSTISTVSLERLNGGSKEKTSEGEIIREYEEIMSGYGLVFRDKLGPDKGKSNKSEAHPEEFPIRAVNKVAFNPNFKSFTHVAVGYNCGLIRILPLREVQTMRGFKFLLDKAQKGSF